MSIDKYIKNFVREFQRIIEIEYEGSISSFLRENGARVREKFARISDLVGYPLDPDVILSESDYIQTLSSSSSTSSSSTSSSSSNSSSSSLSSSSNSSSSLSSLSSSSNSSTTL